MEKERCQSCGMPLGAPGFYGTNLDLSENHDYCKFCFKEGKFTEPKLKVQDMINRSVDFMVCKLHFPSDMAKDMSNSVIPNLKRWKSTI